MRRSFQDFQKQPQTVGNQNCSTWLMRNVCRNVFSQPTDLFCRFCWNDLACNLFLLPLPNCFLRVCLPILFAGVLKFFLPLKTPATSAAANSNNSAPKRFAAGTICSRKNEIAVLPIICASALNPRPRCRPISL